MIFATQWQWVGGPRDMLIHSNNKMTLGLVREYPAQVSELNGDAGGVGTPTSMMGTHASLLFSWAEMLVESFTVTFLRQRPDGEDKMSARSLPAFHTKSSLGTA